MDYSGLNNLLNNLEVDTTTPNNDFNYQLYSDTQRFANPETSQNNLEFNNTGLNTNTNTGLNKRKQKKTIENLSVNRNNEMLEINGMNRHFNFERINPQRDINPSNQDSQDNSSFTLNRNLQINNLTNKRNINIFDNSKFSEDFKNYKDIQQSGNYDNNSINLKLSNRDNIPNLSTVPNEMWK
jgi:hypothetical protein